jgi:phospholipid/cholesterol/gamma-HCH transport system substrate-binding protein
METRANFVLIGAFTLFGILGSLGFFLWLAKVEVDRQYAYYDVLFSDVSGLGEAGDVRYNGLPVGQVVRLSLDDGDPSKVRVRIEIGADIPVKTDTVATLELQGVTGVSYVHLAGGSPEAQMLTAATGEKVPVITAERSAVQSLFEATPELLDRAIVLLEDLNKVVSPENREAVGNLLGNLESASGRLDTALQDFSSLSAELSSASARIAGFTDRLDEVADAATTALGTTDETLQTARVAIEKAQPMIDEATLALASARTALDSADGLMNADLPGLIEQLAATADAIETVVTDVGGKADGLVTRMDRLGETAIARLDQAEATFVKLDGTLDAATATMKSIDEVARSVDGLVKGDGAALVADARQAVGAVNEAVTAANRVVVEDLPVIVADIRATIGTVNTAVEQASGDITSATGKLDGVVGHADEAILGATETFRNANDTLAAITATLGKAEQTLGAAEQTFTGVNRLIDEDAGAIVADIRNSVASLGAALDQVSEDLPQITSEVRQAVGNASQFAGNLNGIVVENSEQIETFVQAGMPQFVRFVQEGSRLVASLQRLTAKIESDPARFLLGTQAPEFER